MWTDDNLQFLHENYIMMTNKQLAEELGCAESTVGLKIKQLGLERPSGFKAKNHHLLRLLIRWKQEKGEKPPNLDMSVLEDIKKRYGMINKRLKLKRS